MNNRLFDTVQFQIGWKNSVSFEIGMQSTDPELSWKREDSTLSVFPHLGALVYLLNELVLAFSITVTILRVLAC